MTLLRRKKKSVQPAPLHKVEQVYGAGAHLVNVRDDSLLEVAPTVPWSDTHYAMDGDGNYLNLVTVTPRGLLLGWDTCGTCMRLATDCECRAGVTMPSGVVHCYVQEGGVLPAVARAERQPLPPSLALREPVTPLRRRKEEPVVTIRRKEKAS